MRLYACDGAPVEIDRSLIGLQQPNEHVEKRCFAGAIRPDQAKDLSLGNIESDTVEGLKTAKAFGNATHLKHRLHRAALGSGVHSPSARTMSPRGWMRI